MSVRWAGATAQDLVQRLRGTHAGVAVGVAVVDADTAVSLTVGAPDDARFEIGSITKTMTGAVLAALADAGTVSLDHEIGRYLDAGLNSAITLGELATHTSGLPRLSPSHIPGAPDPYGFLTAEVAETELRRVPARSSPVAAPEYSNFGYQLLGLALQRATGRPLPGLVADHLLHPLGMGDTGVSGQGGGTELAGNDHEVPVARWTSHLPGAGGVESTTSDMLTYLTACLRPPSSAAGKAIGSAQRPRVEVEPTRSFGLAWVLDRPAFLWHDGGTNGFRSMLGIRADTGRGVVVLVNDASVTWLYETVRSALDS